MKGPRLIRLRYLLWLIVPLGVLGAATVHGVPHGLVGWEGQRHGTVTFRTSCTYLGPFGGLRTGAAAGRCPVLLWLPLETAQRPSWKRRISRRRGSP